MSLFGPIRVRVDLFGVDVRISGEQIVFLAKAVHRLNWQVREWVGSTSERSDTREKFKTEK